MSNTGTATAGHVMCDTCNQRHEAVYSHESQWGDHEPVYVAVCNGVSDYYLAERLIVAEAAPRKGTAGKSTAVCDNCGQSIEKTRYPKRDWYHSGTGKRACQ